MSNNNLSGQIQAIIDLENQLLALLRVAVLHRFYCIVIIPLMFFNSAVLITVFELKCILYILEFLYFFSEKTLFKILLYELFLKDLLIRSAFLKSEQ